MKFFLKEKRMSRGKRKNNAIIVGIEANTHTKFNNIIFFVVVVNKKLRKKHDNKKYMNVCALL